MKTTNGTEDSDLPRDIVGWNSWEETTAQTWQPPMIYSTLPLVVSSSGHSAGFRSIIVCTHMRSVQNNQTSNVKLFTLIKNSSGELCDLAVFL